jgi:hypothetical protein
MRLLLILALALLAVGAVSGWAGAGLLRERRTLRRRGVLVPAVAERHGSGAGASHVYRFVDGRGRTRVAAAARVRTRASVPVHVVYDPENDERVQEWPGLANLAVCALCLLVGALATAAALATLALAVAALG